MKHDITPQVWHYFEEICKIPRPSKKEEKICSYIHQFAEKHKLSYKHDKAGNIVINKPATTGKENIPTVILQCHVDMVCEKNSDVVFNFDTDPIDYYIDGEWFKAQGTTLGADNGIGIAAILAVLANTEIAHGPIEALFTVEEETGLTGAHALQPGYLTGKILLNLDSDREDELLIGCAGGMSMVAILDFEQNDIPPNSIAYKLTLSGLFGGHSGEDINKRRGNAIKILNHFLLNCSGMFGISIYKFEGGNLHNAIPREASAIIVIDKVYRNDFELYLKNETQIWKEALISTAPNLCLTFEPCEMPPYIMDIVNQSCLLNTLSSCPSGVITMSEKVHGLVSTSNNLAALKFIGNNQISITTSQRSDSEELKANISNRVRRIFEMVDAKVESSDGYPGWTPDPHSPILKTTKLAYRHLFGKEPVVKAIHAGLECGLFFEKYPGLDMISFGPTIKDAHSPSEKLHIPSVKGFSKLLVKVLDEVN